LSHRYLSIPSNVDEAQFLYVMSSGGVLPSQDTVNNKCVLTVHPKVGLRLCRELCSSNSDVGSHMIQRTPMSSMGIWSEVK
jgi:hypothetical protein